MKVFISLKFSKISLMSICYAYELMNWCAWS